MVSPFIGTEEYFNNSKEDDNAYMMLVKYMGGDDYTQAKSTFELSGKRNIDDAYNKANEKKLSYETD